MFQHAKESNNLPVTKSVTVITAALTFQLPCELDALLTWTEQRKSNA
jgi:hypothetical protein